MAVANLFIYFFFCSPHIHNHIHTFSVDLLLIRVSTIEEGRGQCIRHLLLKFTPQDVQRHYSQLPPTCVKVYAHAASVFLGVGGEWGS